jgi:hypothetical protein
MKRLTLIRLPAVDLGDIEAAPLWIGPSIPFPANMTGETSRPALRDGINRVNRENAPRATRMISRGYWSDTYEQDKQER